MTHYCFQCGASLVREIVEGRNREICTECGWIDYEHRKVSAAACIEKDGKVLLVQRGIESWKNTWYMPAGYLEVDEEPRECATREVLEETGFEVNIGNLLGIYTYEDDPRGNGIVLLYSGTIIGGDIQPNDETIQVKFFTPDEALALPKAGAGGARQIEDWILKIKESA
jgi:ADP-ribose pyrophosphatase YjhB (NUDIX family)